MLSHARTARLARATLSVAFSLIPTYVTPAQTATWTGAGTDSNWWNPENWSTGNVPNASSTPVVFVDSPRPDPSLTYGPVTVQSVTFEPAAGPYTLSAHTLYTAAITNNSPNLQTITSAVQGTGSAPSPHLSIRANGPILFDAATVTAHTLHIESHSSAVFRSALNVNGGLTKSGTGTVTIEGTASHYVSAGPIHVSAGTLALAMSPGGSLSTQNAIDIGNDAGTESATLRFDADNQNLTNVSNIRIHQNSSIDFNAHAQTIPTLNLFGTATNSTATPQQFTHLYVHPTGVFNNTGGGTIHADIFYVGGTFNHSGTAPLTAGNLYIDGTFNNAGSATITASHLLAGGGTLNSASGLVMANQISVQPAPATSTVNANLDLGGSPLTITGSHHFAADVDLDIVGTISNGTGLTVSPQSNTPPSVRLAGTAANTYSGLTTVQGSTLILAKPTGVAAIPGNLRVTTAPGYNSGRVRLDSSHQIPDSATVTLDAFTTFDLNGRAETISALNGSGTVTLGAGGALTIDGPDSTFAGNVTGAGTFRKSGPGTLTLLGTGGGNFSPDHTLIAAGPLLLTSNQSGVITTLSGNITVGDGSSPASLKTTWSPFPQTGGKVTGALTVHANATVDLSANPNNTGSGATFSFPALDGAGTLVLPANAALTISNSVPSTFSGTIAGTGTGTGLFTKTGAGTLTLASPATYAFNNVALHEGTLVFAKPDGVTAIPGNITIVNPTQFGPGPATLRLAADNQTAGNNVTINPNGAFDLAGHDTALNTLTLAGGTVTTGPGLLTASTLTQSAGSFTGNLRTTTATLSGGTFAGQLTADSFSYSGGAFSGHLTVNNSASFSNNFSASGGMTALANVTVASGRSLTFGGAGLDNQGSLTFSGGTLGGTGPIVNSNRISGFGSIAGSGGFTNNLLLSVTGGNLTLSNSGSNFSYGNIDLATATQLISTGGPLTNYGTISLAASSVTGSATLYNNGSIIGRGLISVPVVNAGTIQPQSGTINLSQPFVNTGLIKLSTGASLAGATIHNTGTIQGDGTVSNPVTNVGTLEPAGTLQLAGPVTNPAAGLISLPAGSKLLISTGLASNHGTVSLIGGTFDNNGQTLTNAGQITGYGTLRTGHLTNNGTITLTGGTTTVNGPVTNTAGHTIEARFDPAIFTSLFTNDGQFKITKANVTFAANSGGPTVPMAPGGLVALATTSPAPPTLGLTGTGTVLVDGSAALTLHVLRQSSLDSAGAVRLLPAALGGQPSSLSSLTLSPTATLDLADNPLSLTTPTGAPHAHAGLALIRQYLLNDQLLSSLSSSTHSLGYLLTDSTLSLRLTPIGDANLDGLLTPDDYALLDKGFLTAGSFWWEGDFTYDGQVDQNDYLALDRAYLSTQAQGLESLGSLLAQRQSQFGPQYVSTLLTSIPEPSCLSSILYPLSSLFFTRRRRNRE